MSDRFYRDFEERYYAPRAVIRGLREQYLDFVKPLTQFFAGSETFDAGCGRGEWLELMSENGFSPIGVDLDEGMLAACHELNLRVCQGDAVSAIAQLKDNSQAIVTAFHVVEHISFTQLRTLVSEALRVIKPGGLLILETPNPENIVVATRNFYLDPTHQRPIPSSLLSFVVEHAGFARVKTIRLQESKDIHSKTDISLRDVFSGASPDYAVVAQKAGPEDVLVLTDKAFNIELGCSLDDLLERWDTRFEGIAKSCALAQTKAQEAESTSRQCLAELHILYASKSWRITAPLRWANLQLKRLTQDGIKARAKAFVKKGLRKMNNELTLRPVMRQRIVRWSRKLGLYPWVKRLLAKVQGQYMLGGASGIWSGQRVPASAQNLSPRARQIYADLKRTIEKNKKG